jgi:glutamate dehydrogenase
MKAHTEKNAVIVPVGAKGGCVVKRPPAVSAALRDEVLACYRAFVRGMLDLTDNLVDGTVVPPTDVVRHDGDDPYLVVAADKGTAAFSDAANDLAAEYGYWLGDAFASGGSSGYDHKEMGITSRGAWISVRAHFRAMDVDADTAELTVVGIGDMSGDVFGNGMLRSEHLSSSPPSTIATCSSTDPTPKRASENARLLRCHLLLRECLVGRLRRCRHLEGRRCLPATAKALPISEEARRACARRRDADPDEVISAILRARRPVAERRDRYLRQGGYGNEHGGRGPDERCRAHRRERVAVQSRGGRGNSG